jgi:hypothetical protein
MAKILKKDAKKYLAKVSQDQAFWCSDGRILKNLRELEKALTGMADKTFAYHSNGDKADFSNWVKNAIGDEQLAKDLGKSPSRTQAAKSVSTRIALLDKTLTAKTRS